MISTFSVYIIKSALLLSLMFMAYKLTAGRLKCASFRRWTLLSVYVLSLILPVIAMLFPLLFSEANVLGAEGGMEVVSVGTMAKSGLDYRGWIEMALIAMTVGSGLAAALSIVGLLWIAKCRMAGNNTSIGEMKVTVVSTPAISPFSFGGRIFMSEADYEAPDDMMIAHEASHIRHSHYIDLLLGRAVAVLQWWNPFAWIMLRELHNVHEYQADSDVINLGHDPREYQYLLLRKAVGSKFQLMTNGLNNSILKSRLKMINRKESGLRMRLATLLCIPAMIVGLMAISSRSFAAYMAPLSQAFSPKVVMNLDDNKSRTATDVEERSLSSNPDVMIDGKLASYDELQKLNPSTIKSITVDKDSEEHPNGLIIIDIKK